MQINSNQVVSTVKDHGDGFDPEAANNPLKEENLLKDSGRGIFLIREISDSVDYLDNGTKIRFSINR